MSPMSSRAAINEFKATLPEEVPLCTGVVSLDANISQLFYNTDGSSSGFIDFRVSTVGDAQFEHLIQACQPATFGIQQKDVLDESYRKAWKMDAVKFSTNFNPYNTGVVQVIRDSLLRDPRSSIRAELHKLNVYGPGSFFKAHVDTPRSDKMFGSLVVVLPTKHEGGTFLLRHHGREWTFDSADILSPQNPPQAAFLGFFGDVEHEVTVVKSGYRVSLTYNLYDDKSSIVPSIQLIDDREVKIMRGLITLLNHKKFLPDGGLLGFGLSYRYPINPQTTQLDELCRSLKGSDAVVKRACDSLSLKVSAKVLYESEDENGVAYLLDKLDVFDSLAYRKVEGDIVLWFKKKYPASGLLVYDPDVSRTDPNNLAPEYFRSSQPILWVKPFTQNYDIKAPFLRYGNDYSLDYAYGEICLVLEVKASEDRKTYHE